MHAFSARHSGTDRLTDWLDHCLEYFREAAMCRGDPTLAFFTWDAGIPKSKRDTTNECVKWDKLRTFAESRMVDVSDYSILNQDG